MKILQKIFGLLLIVGLFSCSDSFLDVDPQTSLSTDMAIGNFADAEVALMGVYDALQSTASYYGRDIIVVPDIAGDDVYVYPQNSGRFLQQYNFTTSPSTGFVSTFWSRAYNAINRANNIIAKADVITDATVAEKDNIIGQALALRALVHFDLLRIYARPYSWDAGNSMGVPYMEVAAISYPSRDNVNFVYDKIVADFTIAIEKLTESAANADKAYITKYGAKALLARVYLYMENWEKASKLAADVVKNGGYTLVPNEGYVASWAQEFTSESIFSLATSNTDYSATDALGYIYVAAGYGDLRPTNDIKQLLASKGGVREAAFFKYDLIRDDFFIAKFPGRGTPSQAGLDNIPVVRLSEMYLIAAEAYAQRSMSDSAKFYLNAIVKRADPTFDDIDLDGSELLSRIYEEKRIEFAFEGHRLFDIARRKEALVRGADCLAEVCQVPALNYLFVFPIPQREMDANVNMRQNSGYEGN